MMTAATRALVSRLAELLASERTTLADFLVTLADFDRQRRWEELGYASLYAFLVGELGMSKGTAFYRRVAVELVQRYPEVLEPLRDGRLCITAVHALSKAITPENRAEVLPRFFHLSKQEAKTVSAEIAPTREVPRKEVVTSLRATPVLDFCHISQPVGELDASAECLPPELALPRPTPVLPPARASVDPLTATEQRLHLTVSPEFLRMLDACKNALSHAMPGADAAAVLQEGMKLILARDAKKKALVEKPRATEDAREDRFDTRYIPAEIRRAVWKRDQGKCQWPLEGGGICGSEFQPELDHIHGFVPGQPVRAEDLRVLCKPHNFFHARKVLGEALMSAYRRRGYSRSMASGPLPPPAPGS